MMIQEGLRLVQRCLPKRVSTRATRPLHMIIGASSRPKTGEGEDALCADISSGFIGLADGVGGSRNSIVDPGAYSRRLLAWCHRHSALGVDAGTILRLGRQSIAKDVIAQQGGSSTLLIATVHGESVHIANFGDSAAVLLRPAMREMRMHLSDNTIDDKAMVLYPRPVLRTSEQCFYFNCPYQSAANDKLVVDTGGIGSCEFDDVSAIARPGDLLLLATDGLFDNLHDSTIERLCMSFIPHIYSSAARHGSLWIPDNTEGTDHLISLSDSDLAFKPPAKVLAHVASRLTEAAIEVFSSEKTIGTPFSMAARTEGYDYQGGKVDDVSVMLALLVPDSANSLAVALHDNFDDKNNQDDIDDNTNPQQNHLLHNFGIFALDANTSYPKEAAS